MYNKGFQLGKEIDKDTVTCLCKEQSMYIIPAIDLIDGKVVRLLEGDFDKKTEYEKDPLDTAKYFQSIGVKRIHIIDLDGAKTGKSTNRDIIKMIKKETDLEVQTGGGIRTEDDVKELIEAGIDNIILGTVLVEDLDMASGWVEKYGNRFLAAIDVRDNILQTRGWLKSGGIDAIEFGKKLFQLGFKTAIFTDISKDGTLAGPSIESARLFSTTTGLRIILSGGIGSLDDIRESKTLVYYGMSGLIVGKAYYDGKVDIKTAVDMFQDFE
jgi:phosphoribosylformimino-5-aminoimidazole carboxamide ribotide isomerase